MQAAPSPPGSPFADTTAPEAIVRVPAAVRVIAAPTSPPGPPTQHSRPGCACEPPAPPPEPRKASAAVMLPYVGPPAPGNVLGSQPSPPPPPAPPWPPPPPPHEPT